MTIASEADSVRITSSYASDPLPDLLIAVANLKSKASRFEIVNVDAENREFDLLLTEVEQGTLRIEVMEDAYIRSLDESYHDRCPMPTFTTYCFKSDFCDMVRDNINDLAKAGIPEYNEQWSRFAFPEAELAALNQLYHKAPNY